MERDAIPKLSVPAIRISTHTLTWSVTSVGISAAGVSYNFNSHAHVERDDIANDKSITVYHFNSHAHVERDVILRALLTT